MNIQSLSIVVPTHGCMNQCKFCVSRMHKEEYPNLITEKYYLMKYHYINRMAFARDNGCNTVMLTGQGEPQQNMEFLKKFGEMNKKLDKPFRNIEIQTTGAKFDIDMFMALEEIGVTTVSFSVSCLNDNEINSEIINGNHTPIDLKQLCTLAKAANMNVRLSLNMTRWLFVDDGKPNVYPNYEDIFKYCSEVLKVDQVTFRKMYFDWHHEFSQQAQWLRKNELEHPNSWFKSLNEYIASNGCYLDTLEYGSKRYSVMGMSTVIDEDCMAKSEEKKALKYLILRPNCKLYTQWDDKGSLLF